MKQKRKGARRTLLSLLAPVESKERKEKSRKRKRAKKIEVPREPAPTTVPTEESDNEERGGFEAYSEQLVLSPTIDEAAPAQSRAEKRVEHKVKTEESSTSELLILTQEIRN